MRDVVIAGAAMTRFGKFPDTSLKELAGEATRGALGDAGLGGEDVEQVFFANAVAGLITGQEMVRGQAELRETGLLGIPIFNVENACASASSAFNLAWMSVVSGQSDCVIVVGAEKLVHPDKRRSFEALAAATDLERRGDLEDFVYGEEAESGSGSLFMDVYALLARRYSERSGAGERDFAQVAVKNHHHGALNPKAQYRDEVTVEEVLASRQISGPLHLLMCSPLGDGAAALVLCSAERAAAAGADAVHVRATAIVSGRDDDGPVAVERAAARAYEQAGVGPEDLDVLEVHDAAAPAELQIYEELGLCAAGEGPALLASGATALGGRVPVNPSGGLLSKGHPVGATGCAQLVELTEQLRGRAGERQVEGARVALAENAGGFLGPDQAVAAVTILARDAASRGELVSGLSVASIFEDAYVRFASRPALIGGSRTRTYAELGERAHRFASGLRGLGVEPGDRVALVAPNSLSYIEASHGIFTGGFLRVALSAKLHPEEIGQIVADCGARALVVGPECAARLDEIPGASEARAIVFGEGNGGGGAIGYEELLAQGSPERPERTPAPEDLCALLYTSGTTGMPKGATLTHANWVAMMRNSMAEMPTLGTADVVLHVAPLSHLSGYFEPTCSARGAAHVVQESFDPAAALDAIERERITVVPLVPTMLNLMLPEADAGDRDLSSLRAVMYGGSGIAPDRLAWAVRAFGDVFCQFFGLSETPMPLTALSQRDHEFDPDGPVPARLASAGRPNPFVELRLRDDDGGAPAIGEVGEIMVHGDNVMVGYWGNPELTAATIDEDGWAVTGDLGRFDEDGYLYIVDRKRDMIVSGGYNVYPAEVENAISVLPEVQEVAVVGVPDERWGEAVKAVVVVRDGAELDEAAVVGACTERLAGYKKPRSVDFVDVLAKTGSGKLMRRRIREGYWRGRERSVGG